MREILFRGKSSKREKFYKIVGNIHDRKDLEERIKGRSKNGTV